MINPPRPQNYGYAPVTLQFPPNTYPVLYSDITANCQNAAEVSAGGGEDINGILGSIPAGTDFRPSRQAGQNA